MARLFGVSQSGDLKTSHEPLSPSLIISPPLRGTTLTSLSPSRTKSWSVSSTSVRCITKTTRCCLVSSSMDSRRASSAPTASASSRSRSAASARRAASRSRQSSRRSSILCSIRSMGDPRCSPITSLLYPCARVLLTLPLFRPTCLTHTASGHLGGLRLEPVACLEDPPHRCQAQDQEEDRHGQAQAHAYVCGPVEAPPETADQVDHRIEEGDRLPERRQHIHGVEAAAEKDQGRNDKERHELQLLEALGPDTEDEAEEAEGEGREHEEQDHQERVRDLKRHEQARRGQDDQAENDRLGRCRPDVTDDDLDVGDGSRQDLVDSAREFGEEDAERRVGDALRKQRQHDQAWHDERAVADPVDVGDAWAYRRPEYDEVQGSRDDGRDDALQQRAKRPCHLENVDRPDRMKVHRSSFTRLTNISSSELCLVWRSLNPMSALVRSASRAVMSVCSVCVS